MNEADMIKNTETELKSARSLLSYFESRVDEMKVEIETKVEILKALKGE